MHTLERNEAELPRGKGRDRDEASISATGDKCYDNGPHNTGHVETRSPFAEPEAARVLSGPTLHPEGMT